MAGRLEAVLKSVEAHQSFLTEQYSAYKSYLDDVYEKCASANNGKFVKIQKGKKPKKVASKPHKTKVLGPFKYSYSQLEKDGIIKESEIPKER